MNATIEVTEQTVEDAHKAALQAARQETAAFLGKHGGTFDACGFAWVTVYEKGTSKLIRTLKKLGFSRAYGGGYQLWNPSGSHTQSITAKEEGAEAYVKVFRQHFPTVKIYAGSRMD